MEIDIHDEFDPEDPQLENRIAEICKSLDLGLDFLYIKFVNDEELLEVNKNYLNHNYYTDIITFDLRDEISDEAEIYISNDRVKENAATNKVSFIEEKYRVIIHGLLHLSGMSDKSDFEKAEMRSKENEYLEKVFHVKHL